MNVSHLFRTLLRRDSLSRQVFIALIAGELAFAIVLGLTIGAFSSFAVAREREESIRQVTATIAAGLMPTVADEQGPQVLAQLASILDAVKVRDVVGICLTDSSGAAVACQWTGDAQNMEPPSTPKRPLSVLLEEQVIYEPVVVDGLKVAEVQVRFAAPGLASLTGPVIASAVILISVMLVSVPWTAWLLVREVIEPLEDLGHYASRIAEGELDAPAERKARAEVGELQVALSRMAQQLGEGRRELRESYANLSEAYLSLETAKGEIEQLLKMKSDFVAVAAHEIRGPLSTISVYSELLETGELGELDDAELDAIAAIGNASARLASIVSDLMDSALLERGLMHIEFGDVWVGELLERAVADAAVAGSSREMAVELDDGVFDSVIVADELRLRQVLDNLLSNALKYSPDGSTVHVSAREEGGWVDIEVADRGRGIPPGRDEQLFALFGRLDFGDSRDTAGLGLGLAISARIAQAHGGSISYRANEAGKGSVFVVRLPVGGPAAAVSAEGTAIRVTEGTDET